MPALTIKFEHLTNQTREELESHPVHRSLPEALERWEQYHPELCVYLFREFSDGMRMFVFAKKLPFGLYDVKTYAFPVKHDFVDAAGRFVNFPGTKEARRRIANLRKLKRGDEVVEATMAYLKVAEPDMHWELTSTEAELMEGWGLAEEAPKKPQTPKTPRKVGHLTVIK
jgi:hypothetical protein